MARSFGHYEAIVMPFPILRPGVQMPQIK